MPARGLYSAVTVGGVSLDTLSVEVSEGHKQVTSRCSLETEDITGITLNDPITIDIGYDDSHGVIFVGYVDEIVETRMPGTYQIEGRDVLKRAIDHYLVTTDIENPWSRKNISAEDLVKDLLHEAGIINYVGAVSHFTFGVKCDAEFNLMSSWDAVRTITHIIAYNCYAEDGVVYFKRVLPVPAAIADHSLTIGNLGNLMMIEYVYNTDNLRNRVVVFGRDGIYAEEKVASPYLPADFYKTAIVSNELIDTQRMADRSAAYNLELYNRLTETTRVEAVGNHSVRCRHTIAITEPFTEQVAERWFIYSASHRLDDNGYKMSLSLAR